MKKLLSLLLAAMMVLSIAAVPAFADAAAELTVTGAGETIRPGDKFTAEIKVPKFDGELGTGSVAIAFDTKVLEATAVKFSGQESLVTNAAEGNAAGEIVATWDTVDTLVLTSDQILTVDFKVREDAASGTYDKLVWISEAKTKYTDEDDVKIPMTLGNKTFGATVAGKNPTVIPAGAPFTAVYTDIEGAPVTITKKDGKENYEVSIDYDGGETDRWHIVVPENAKKLYLVYPKANVNYINDGATKLALGYQKYYFVGSDAVEKGLFDTGDFEIDGDNIIIAVNPSEFAGEQQIESWMGTIKYTRGFTFRNNSNKATGHITIAYGDAYYSNEDLAKAVDDLIARIGTVELTDASKAKIDEARAAYNKLTDAQKKLVKNLKTLTDAEAEYDRLMKEDEERKANEAAAKAVDDLIAKIGKVELTDTSKAKIDEARAAYNKLTDVQKKLVKNLKTLTDAEAEYQRLLDKRKADEAAAKAVDNMVNKLQPVTLSSGKAIEEARKAFDALTPDQKKLLDPATEGKLVAAENEYKQLMKDNADKLAAKEVEDKIAKLQPVTKNSGDAIKDARSSYEALTPEQKKLVSKDSLNALEKAEKQYGMIVDSNKPGTLPGGRTDSSSSGSSGVIKITTKGDSKGEQNPNTGAPVMSIAPAMFVLAAAVLVLKKRG